MSDEAEGTGAKFNNDLVLPKKYKRPTLAQFVAAHYPAEQYEPSIARHEAELAEAYASGEVTDETFVSDSSAPDSALDGPRFHVRSQVRRIETRTLRARQPTRHRFKQYLFSDPSKRLVRRRPLTITATELEVNLPELLDKEAAGILSVHMLDGRRVNLSVLEQGASLEEALATPTPSAPLPRPPLDSAARDVPAGEAFPQYVDGTFPGDPAAQRALERVTAEKAAEASRQGADSAPVDPEASTEPSPGGTPDAPPAGSTSSEGEFDPAAERAAGSPPAEPGQGTEMMTGIGPGPAAETSVEPNFEAPAPADVAAEDPAAHHNKKDKKAKRGGA